MTDTEFFAKKAFFFSRGPRSLQSMNKVKRLTFFSLSIHLLMAGIEDPVRSLRAKIAAFTISIVAMVVRDALVLKEKFWGSFLFPNNPTSDQWMR